jgi:cell division protein FtsW
MTDTSSARSWGQERPGLDVCMVALTAALVGFGIVAVFSATFARAALSAGDSLYKVKPQAAAAVAGALAMFVVARLNLERIRQLAYGAAALAGLALVAVLVLGVEINGARRWFEIGPCHIQPSEFAKLAVIVAAARFAVENPRRIRSLNGLALPMAAVAVGAGLVLAEHDLGTAVVVTALAFLMWHFAGAKLRHLAVYAVVGLACVTVAIVAEPYRLARIKAWCDPGKTALTSGYQQHHSVIALGAGGVIGRGLGEGREKYSYLPAAETDCIFAVIGEEMGLLGTWVLLALFGLLLWRGLAASLRVADPFCALLGAGMTSLIALQVLINVAVVTGLMPAKGAPLPFVSYGGSSLVSAMTAVGVLLNVSRQPRRDLRPRGAAAGGASPSRAERLPFA